MSIPASPEQSGSIGVSIDIGIEEIGGHKRQRCLVVKVHEGGIAHGIMKVGDEIVAINPNPADGTGPKLISGEEINFSMEVIPKLILGPPGTQVTLDIIRQQPGTRNKKWFKFAFYRQKPLSDSPDIRSPVVSPEPSYPALAAQSASFYRPEPGAVGGAPLAHTAQPSPIETVPSTVASDSSKKLISFKGCSSISEIDSEIHRVLSKQLESEKIERFETLMKVNSAKAFEFIDSEKRRLLSGRSTGDRLEPESAVLEDESEEETGPRRFFSVPGVSPLCPSITPISERNFDKITGFSAIRAFLEDSSVSAFFQLTVFGRGFNNDKGHRKDLWLRLLVSLPNDQEKPHEWIDGSNRYLRKEVGRKDEHVNFNRTRNETDFVPFEFNLAKMLQGQRKNYESARVRIIVMKQQHLPSFCEIGPTDNELGYFECPLNDLVRQPAGYSDNHEKYPDAWKKITRSNRGIFLSEFAGEIRFKVARWATNLNSQVAADAGNQPEPVLTDKMAVQADFRCLSELFEAKQALYEQIWPKSAERYLRETVETLDEVIKNVQLYLDNPEERRIVFAGLSQKIRNLQEAFGPDSENWTSVSEYSSLFSKANIPFMLALLSETGPQSILKLSSSKVKNELIPFFKNLKTILKNMFPINMPYLAELMRNSSAASVSMSGKTVSLLIGSSQAGKSTILNFLGGAVLKVVRCAGSDVFRLSEIPRTLPTDTARALEQIAIGSGFRSETIHVRLLPIHHKGVDHYFCDAPGFGDDRGPEVDISNGIGVVSALKKSDGVKIILVFSGAQIGLRREGLQDVFKKVAEIVANGLDEALPKIVYMFNNAGDHNFHGLLSDVFSENEPESFELKKIFTDAICKTCSTDCAFLREVRQNSSANPFICRYASSHSGIAKHCFPSVSAACDASEVDEAEYIKSVFAKQKSSISKLTKDDLKTGARSNFRNAFLEHVGQQELAIDPKCLKFVCSDESIDILHDSLVQLPPQIDHWCSLNNFRPDIVESKIDQLVSLGATNLFHESFPTKPGVDILQDYKNVLQKIITITETSAQEFLDFVQKIIKITETSAPDKCSQEFIDFVDKTPSLSADALFEAMLSFWRLIQLSNSHRIVTAAEGFPQLELKCMNLLPVSDLFNRWVDFQDSLGKQFLDALNESISNQTAFPSERFQSLVLAMCTVSDLGTIGRKNLKNVSSELLNTGESTSSVLKKKYTQTMSLIFNKYDALCRETSSMFNECAKSVVHFLNDELRSICIVYFKNLNRIRIFADLLMTLCAKEKEQYDIQLIVDGTGLVFNEDWVTSRQKTANRALFEILASIRASSMMSSVDDMLCRQSSFEQVLDCFENSVLMPLSNFQFILDSAKSHFSSWDHFDQAIVLRHESVESVYVYIRSMMERCGSVVLNSSQSAASLSDIKKHISQSVGIPVALQRLSFEHNYLSDNGNVPCGGILHLSLYHASHADVDTQEASPIMPKAARITGNAETQIRLPDQLFPIARQYKISQDSRSLTDLFKYWVFFLELITRCGRINDASSSEFVKETQQKIAESSRFFLEKISDHVEQFISNIELKGDCKYDEAEWDCFSQYMVHLSDFADAFSDASLSSKNLFQKECEMYNKISQKCHTAVKSLSKKLADDSQELARLDSKLAPLISMKRKCSSLFVACDELLNLLHHADKIQSGSTLRSESSENSELFVDSMVQFIEPLSFNCQDKKEAVQNKLDWLHYLLEECDCGDRKSQEIFDRIAEKVRSVNEQCLVDWHKFLADCSSTLQEYSSAMERFINEDFHSVQQSQEHQMQTWGGLQTHVSCVVGVLIKQQLKPHLPIFFNLAKFKNLQSHPVFNAEFNQVKHLSISGLQEDTMNLMRRLDALFLKLISFCADDVLVADMQRRYQTLSDLLRMCQECSGIDAVWSESGFERGKSTNFFADQVLSVQGQLISQKLSMELKQTASVKNLEVPTLLAEWPSLSPQARQVLQVDITNKLKESAQKLQDSFESMFMKKEHSPLYGNGFPQDIDSNQVILAFGSWAPVVFKDQVQLQDDLFEKLNFCYDALRTGTESSVSMCKKALGGNSGHHNELYEFQNAEEHFKVVDDGHQIVDKHLKTLKSVENYAKIPCLQKAVEKMKSLAEWCQRQVTDLRSEFDLASKTVLKIYDCKSAVIKGPANIEKQKNYDNLFVHVPIIVGIGIEITENQKHGGRVEIANVFDGSPAWHCGIRRHDVLLQVDSLSCIKQSKLSIQQIRQAIMGPRGTLVEIRIQRESRTLTVKRDIFGTPLPETQALSSANPVFPTSLLFRKFSSDNNLVILLENEDIKPLPKDEKKPHETDAEKFCSLDFGELRSKIRGPVRILDKLNPAQQYRHTGTEYDEIQKQMKAYLEKELSAFVDLLLSKHVTSEDAGKWQNYDIFSEELLAHLPGTKEKMQQLKRKIDGSSENGLKASSVKPSPSIADEVTALQSCHLIKTSSVIRSVEVIEDKICAYCKEMIESPELLQRYLEPEFRQEYTRWSLFWHFLHCLDPPQAMFQARSWQSWKHLESAFRKSVCSRIPGRCCDAFSDAAFTQSSHNSQDVVGAVEASFMILRQKPFWKTATLSDFFHDENFHDVLQKCVSSLRHFFIEKKQEFDAYLKTMSRDGDWMREKKADSAWMTNYFRIYKLQSATSECLLKHSEDPSISWIVDSNGLLREFGADLVPSASSDRMHFPFVSTFVQLDQRIRDIFKVSLEIVQARFHESDDCRSPSYLNHEKVYKQLNDQYQIVKDFVKVFPGATVEVAPSNPQIPRTAGGVLDDVQLHFNNVLNYFKSEQEKVMQILTEDAVISQFQRQIDCYAKLMVFHHNLGSWKKTFEDTTVKEQVSTLLTKMNDDAGRLLSKIGEGIQHKAIDTTFTDFGKTKNIVDVCSLFRVLRCMASHLPLKINQGPQSRTAEAIIDQWFKRIMNSNRGSFRMKRISSRLTDDRTDVDPDKALFSKELIEKHKAFENVQIIEYNALTSGFGIEMVVDEIKVSAARDEMTRDSKANILQQYDHYHKVCNRHVRDSILIIKNFGQKADWKTPLKTILQSCRKKMDAPPVTKILDVLAVASAYWTVDIFAAGSLDDDLDPEAVLLELKQPHAAQIATILRLLGLDKIVLPKPEPEGFFSGAVSAVSGAVTRLVSAAPSEQAVVGTVKGFIEDNLDPHMVEVLTGQGKSVVLALTSIVLAFFGFRVDCACYSEYLSDRDRKEFKNVFDFFDVDKYILFSTFNTICERTINEAGDVRTAVCGLVGTGASFLSKAEKSDEPPRRKIALIDEVDVFFSRSFYGQAHTYSQEYIPVARVEHACVAELIRQVYELSRKPPSSKRLDAYTMADIEKHLPAYNDCKRVFRDWEFLIDHAVASMLCDVMQFEDPSKNPYQKVESTRMVGYQEGDQISYSQTRRYMTVFAWLKEYSNDPKSIDAPPASHMRLLVDCGHFGYEKIVRIGDQMHEYACILGVTGTLEPVMREVDGKKSEQRKILERFCLREATANRPPKSLQCTFVPSVYPRATGGLTFLDRAKKSIAFVKNLDEFYATIFKEIEDCNQEQNKGLKISRAVLVVFETSKQLEDCADSKHLAPYKGVIQKLTPEMSDAMIKKNIIEQASFPGKVTFMTREFGRGTDFKGTNKDMNECGGVHVIQTFLSEELTEEKQIQGRTARQGQNGSYCLVLLCKSLEKYLTNFKYKDDPPESEKDASYEYFVGGDCRLEKFRVVDAFDVLNAARQNFFTKDFEKSGDSKGSDDYYHNQAMDFRQALAAAVQSPKPTERADSLALVKKFLKTMNGSVLPPPVVRPIKRTLVLLDATGSMGSSIDACKKKIEEVCARAYDILEKAELDACFEVQFATFRNYDQDPPHLLSCSNWEKKPYNLKSFISSVRAFGGTHEEEAVEVALQYANSEHSRNPISQVILIGDAPSNTADQVAGGRRGDSRGCKLSPLTWKGTSMADQTFWEDECVKLRANGIPVHAFHVNKRSNVVENFKQISQKAGENGVSQFLDIASSQGATILCNLLTKRILESLGQTEEEKKLFNDLYLRHYPDAKIMH